MNDPDVKSKIKALDFFLFSVCTLFCMYLRFWAKIPGVLTVPDFLILVFNSVSEREEA